MNREPTVYISGVAVCWAKDKPDNFSIAGWAPMFTAEQLAEAVRLEREACLQICEDYTGSSSSPMNFAENCAEAIRARSEE